eukprot:1136919-Pelagomonas_calceolata.AAC.2
MKRNRMIEDIMESLVQTPGRSCLNASKAKSQPAEGPDLAVPALYPHDVLTAVFLRVCRSLISCNAMRCHAKQCDAMQRHIKSNAMQCKIMLFATCYCTPTLLARAVQRGS